jgi:hypothetical protein
MLFGCLTIQMAISPDMPRFNQPEVSDFSEGQRLCPVSFRSAVEDIKVRVAQLPRCLVHPVLEAVLMVDHS